MEVVLRVISGPHQGLETVLAGAGTYVAGRSLQAALSLPRDPLMSRDHFQISIKPPVCELLDLNSTNGTKVNALRVERARLRDGDRVDAGASVISVAIQLTDPGGRKLPQCAGCGQRPSADAVLPEAEGLPWLCPSCEGRRRQFPPTDPDYLFEKKVGSGGMGEVYLARQLSTNRAVAIKMMVPTGAAPEKAREYFRREMLVLKDLLMANGECHRNITAFYDIFEIDGQFQLVMEYVPGQNALEWVNDLKQPLPIATAARIGRHLLAALEYAHGRGYVHRDVKPSNLLITGPMQRPKIKLGDFGLAKSFRENSGFQTLTRQGDIGGSVGFISPDHVRDFRDLKEPADIYSAAVTLYYLLTQHYPYLNFDPNSRDAYSEILEHPAIPLRAFRPDAPEGLERILAKAMEKEPRDRWKSAAAMSAALKPYDESGLSPSDSSGGSP